MAILLRNGSVFLHVPKTGGSWITSVLEEQGLVRKAIEPRHASMDHVVMYQRRFPRRVREFASFCFVRNPLTWYESWFKDHSAAQRRNRSLGASASGVRGWHPNFMLNGCESPDFNEFVRNVLTRRPGYVTEMYGWYAKPPVSFVGRQEHLLEDLVSALRICEVDFDEGLLRMLGPENVGKTSSAIEWDPKLRAEVIRAEYAGFLRYGYEPV